MSSSKTSKLILPGILLGVILGALLGYFVSDFMLAVSIIGELFFNALLILVLPLVLTAVINGVTALGDYRKLGRVGGKTLWYFLATGLIAVVLAVAVSLINFGEVVSLTNNFRPVLTGADSPYLNYTRLMNAGDSSLWGGLLGNMQYLALVLLAIVFGGVLSTFGPRNAKSIKSFFKEVNDVFLKLFEFFLYLAPVGVFSLIGTAVALSRDNLANLFTMLGVYLLILVGTFLVYGLVILPIIFKVTTNRSPLQFFNGMLPAMFTAFATASSTATLAVTYQGAVERNRVDQRAGALVLPLGTVFNVAATAMWLIISILAIARYAPGVELTALQVISVAVLSLLISIGLAGVPRITWVASIIIMSLSGLPEVILAGTATLLIAEWLTDRLRSCLNVWGDAVGAAVISESFEFKAVGRKVAGPAAVREPRTRMPHKGRKTTRADTRKTAPRERTRATRTLRGSSSRVQQKDTRGPERPVRNDRTGSASTGFKTPETKRNGFRPSVKSQPSPFEITESALPELEPDMNGREQKKSMPVKTPPSRGQREGPPPSRTPAVKPHTEKTRLPKPVATPPPKSSVERKPEKKEDILDNEMFKKELARVSAHLQAIEKVKESVPINGPDLKPADEVVKEDIAKKAPVSFEEVSPEPAETAPDDHFEKEEFKEAVEEKIKPVITPEINFLDRMKPEEDIEETLPEEQPVEEVPHEPEKDFAPVASETEPPAAMVYGRSRLRKGGKPNADSSPAGSTEDTEKVPESEESFSNENITFGRTKKKRIR